MKKRKNMQSASIRTRASLARMATPLDDAALPKMTAVKALLASGEQIDGDPVFPDPDKQLKPHGNLIEKGFHAVGAPLSRWRLIHPSHCVRGKVYQGEAAKDSDTNFALVIPKFDATGALGDEAKKINQKIDDKNTEQHTTFAHIDVFSQNNDPQKPDVIFVHCEVDKNRLADLEPDLVEMKNGDCYDVCGQLVMDTFHGGLYELHPVQTIDKC
jgi:hypothetical protein